MGRGRLLRPRHTKQKGTEDDASCAIVGGLTSFYWIALIIVVGFGQFGQYRKFIPSINSLVLVTQQVDNQDVETTATSKRLLESIRNTPIGSLGPKGSTRGRENYVYYDYLYLLCLRYGGTAQTLLEVGCADDPFSQHLSWIDQRTCVAPYFRSYTGTSAKDKTNTNTNTNTTGQMVAGGGGGGGGGRNGNGNGNGKQQKRKLKRKETMASLTAYFESYNNDGKDKNNNQQQQPEGEGGEAVAVVSNGTTTTTTTSSSRSIETIITADFMEWNQQQSPRQQQHQQQKKFDLVLCNQVLEHVVDPASFLQKLIATTKQTLIISVPHKWPKCRPGPKGCDHLHDNIRLDTVLQWSAPHKPIYHTVIQERTKNQKGQRLFLVFDTTSTSTKT